MSQLVLDDQLDVVKILPGLRRWASPIRLQQLRPGEHILDDRVPEILRTCNQPTFLTIDDDFWKPIFCHRSYCIIVAEIDFRRQQELPELLRQLYRHARFKTRAQRMGKVIRLSHDGVWYWEVGANAVQQIEFRAGTGKRLRKT